MSLLKSVRTRLTRARSRDAAPPTLGLVLAGGGARASFQIGVLQRLVFRHGLTFDTIAGTSAGAILTGVLAQYADHEGQRRAVSDLTRLWRDLTGPEQMFRERAWFTLLQDHAPAWQNILRSDSASRTPRTIEIPGFTWPWRKDQASDPITVTLPGIPQALSTITDLWTVAGPGSGLDSIARGALTSSSIFTPGALVDRIVTEIFDPQQVAASGVRARFTVAALESGELRYVDESGQLRSRDDVPTGVTVDLVDAIAASCAIPAVFPPVKLGDEHYVDGGVRMNMPTEVITEHLPVDRCIAISSAPVGVQPQPSFEGSNIISIVARSSASLMAEEISRHELAATRAAGAIVIDPQTEVHDAMTVEPGLVRLAMDYGYLRAAQVMAAASVQEVEHGRHLIEIRRLLWAIEAQEHAAGDEDLRNVPASQIVAEAHSALSEEFAQADSGQLRRSVVDLTRSLPTDHLPPGAEMWGKRAEFVPQERSASH